MKAYCLSKGSKLKSLHYVLFRSTNDTNDCKNIFALICGFHKKSFIMNAPLVSCPFPVIRFGTDDWKWATEKRCINNK